MGGLYESKLSNFQVPMEIANSQWVFFAYLIIILWIFYNLFSEIDKLTRNVESLKNSMDAGFMDAGFEDTRSKLDNIESELSSTEDACNAIR